VYKINVITSFPGAHHLNGYPGACKNLHGHNWKVRVRLVAQNTNELGMAIDFKVVKERLNGLIELFDHQYLNDLEWFQSQNPTSENIAKVIYHELQKAFNDENISVEEVEIWESELTSVIFKES
jgi:6-pyruvoyltetrahydropterin/6-carboxytetrahydropterin synthase